MKVIHKDMVKTEESAKHLSDELKVLKLLKHKNCIQFVRYFEDDLNVYILMEPIWGGSLESLIQTRGRLEEAEV